MPEREGVGRRVDDEKCREHELEIKDLVKDMDTITQNVAKNSGRFAAMLWFMAIVGAGMTIGITVVITMLLNIQSGINTSNGTMIQHAEQIRALRDIEIPSLKSDIKEIQERHKFEEQHRK